MTDLENALAEALREKCQPQEHLVECSNCGAETLLKVRSITPESLAAYDAEKVEETVRKAVAREEKWSSGPGKLDANEWAGAEKKEEEPPRSLSPADQRARAEVRRSLFKRVRKTEEPRCTCRDRLLSSPGCLIHGDIDARVEGLMLTAKPPCSTCGGRERVPYYDGTGALVTSRPCPDCSGGGR